jgi:tetratricopeptide (TPR) repeat protein
MRQLFQHLRKDLEGFVEQRDDLLLLAACGADDTAIALKALRDLDRASPADAFLLFADDFADAESFVATAIRRFQEEHGLACESRAQAGDEPLPPWPGALSDASRPPADRLHEAMGFARSLLPRAGGHRLVWAMFPAGVADWSAYLRLVASCAPRPAVQPWMGGLRLVFRVQAGFALADSPLAGAARTRLTRVDFGPAALEASFRKEANDQRLPVAERMEALLSLALLAAAHGRTQEARTHFEVLLDHHSRSGNPQMHAVVLNGLGDLEQRQGNSAKARSWYERAVRPAAAARQATVLATVVQNLAAVAYQQRAYADAEVYYDGLVKLKDCLVDEDGKAMALEWRGLSQEKQNAYDRAVASWEEAELLSRAFELPHRLRPVLEHLRRGYRQLKNQEAVAAVETELRQVKG